MSLIEIIKSHMTNYPKICEAIADMELSCSYPMKMEDSATGVSDLRVCNSNPEFTVIVHVNRRITLRGDSIVDANFMQVLRQAIYDSFPEAVYTGWIKNIDVRQRGPLAADSEDVIGDSDIDQLFD